MTVPAIFGRVPSLLASQISLRNATNTNIDLLKLNNQLSSGLRIDRPSEDPIAAAVVGVLDNRLEGDTQRLRNMGHGGSVLNSLDSSLGEMLETVLEAQSIASSQIGVGSDAGTRAAQAEVIDQMITQITGVLNRDMAGIHYFGGSRVTGPPIESFFGGYRYTGAGQGLRTDLGPELDFPITLGAEQAAGSLSTRVRGDRDLNPRLTDDTFVRDLRGPMVGRELGTLTISVDSGTPVFVDVNLADAETIGDVRRRIEAAIRDADPAALGGAFPNAVQVAGSGDRLEFASINPGTTISFVDGPVGETASALGLEGTNFTNVVTTAPGGNADLDPAVTARTTLGALNPSLAALDFGDITIVNGGRTGTVTTSAGMTVAELAEEVSRLNLGVRLEIDGDGDRLAIRNEVAGMRMAVYEGGGASFAAETLGLRTSTASTRIDTLNDGRGVEISDGQTDPTTGLPDAARNLDFEVTLTDGSTFTVDLVPSDMETLSSVVAKINSEAAAAGLGGVFTASVNATGGGIRLADTAGGGGTIGVSSLNGYAAEDLGLLDGSTGAASYAGTDRSTVRVDGLLSSLVELRDALLGDDVRGITRSSENLQGDIDLLTSARALVGTRSARVEQVQTRTDERMLLDRSIKSDLQDLDFIEASTRFSLLQTQLQAAYQVTASSQSLSLLNFLG
jgi:flagellin-like hook-associated protein FlgL